MGGGGGEDTLLFKSRNTMCYKRKASDTGLTPQCSARLGMSQRALQGPGKARRKRCHHYKTGETKG